METNISYQKNGEARLRLIIKELSFICISSVLIFLLAGKLDIFENLHEFVVSHEEYELDEVFTVTIYLILCLLIFSFRWLKTIYYSELALKKTTRELSDALHEVDKLRGILPICSSCKKIRDDEGSWQELEAYIHNCSGAEFSHGLCTECATELYPDIDFSDLKDENQNQN